MTTHATQVVTPPQTKPRLPPPNRCVRDRLIGVQMDRIKKTGIGRNAC
jgi:hypothetical protein